MPKKSRKERLSIVTFPLNEAGLAPLSQLTRILCQLSEKIYIISGGEAQRAFGFERPITNIRHNVSSNTFFRIANYFRTQVRISTNILMLRDKVDQFVFFLGAEIFVMPIICSRLLNKKNIVLPAGNVTEVYKARKDYFVIFTEIMLRIVFFLADSVILYSSNMMSEKVLSTFRNKISFAHQHFVDTESLSIAFDFEKRSNVIGFIGRLSEEKGILNLIQAIPEILRKHEVKFVIVGDGPVRKRIEQIINVMRIGHAVSLVGWVPHSEVPRYLNQLILLVLPSYTEGLPNTVLEAMACGTPVLMTRVGALADMAEDGMNIFFLDSNDSARIAEKINLILAERVKLQEVSRSAQKLIRDSFTFETASRLWENILTNGDLK